ncbi:MULTISPECIES: carbohydrate ABC transporter permease [Paenibacillus]|uniref:ABC transporter n=2 Tax=Paenibacillus TaxID=44249 RepID=A0A268EX96_9BACL|nr:MULTISPECIES: sugar ABC transporter permease [Paenibacillus]MUG68292.1 ABC transporter permease subunit [Paenibacillus campinasensis]PAD77751.1 ABC transporter [Paenibacillus campinasensis]PAK48069.1 ABC transporter [Paenibacillus sp. 7541]
MNDIKAFGFMLPALIPLMLFWFIPFGYIAYLSFMEWDFMNPVKTFVGFENYQALFSSKKFWDTVRVTLWFCAGSVIPIILGGLSLALLLSDRLKGSFIYRTLMFSPWVTPTVAVSIVWSWIYEPRVGLANTVLGWFGAAPVRWLEDPHWALVAVLIVTIWKSAGWSMIFYMVAIRNVPRPLLEAASLDGAGSVKRFLYVTLPLISPTTFFLFIVQTISALQAYDQINILTQGGPAGSTRTILYMYYQSAFQSYEIGEASTVAMTLVLFCLLLSLLSFWVGKRTVHYNA